MKSILLFIVSAAFCSATYAQGYVYTFNTTTPAGTETEAGKTQMSVLGTLMKLTVHPGEGEQADPMDEVIFDGERMMLVSHRDKKVMVMDKKAASEIGSQVGEAAKMVDEAMANLPESVRRQIEEAQKSGAKIPGMPDMKPQKSGMPLSDIEDTGDRASKYGYDCTRKISRRDRDMIAEYWVTNQSNVVGGAQVAAAFEAIANFSKEMMDSFGSASGMDLGAQFFGGSDSPWDTFKSVNGIPVVVRTFENGTLVEETILESASKADLKRTDFVPRDDYEFGTMGQR